MSLSLLMGIIKGKLNVERAVQQGSCHAQIEVSSVSGGLEVLLG